ncbi:short-chain fatty acyl-CoA regulator family protein [Roseomonas sp. OT10]|uniref:helix-turn-helix domain-containing protein n=1 Tax=Roseomonas cutis TaxID=2897332 RepID=UPI001E545EF3|nr:short-chain fatty acyl-CoA regulator family protein [Roseomonas sp. OT10]UFN48117.1 short-chain fatty acyl-CoA regulator family protein [Roseomonas sp. OT10]
MKNHRSTLKEPKVFAGDRLRRLRLSRGLSQAALARSLAVSASYLSQMEADLRPMPPALRIRAAECLGVPEGLFGDGDDDRIAGSLREATGDPLFGRATVSAEEARAAIRAAPEVAERFLVLYRAYLALDEQHQALRSRAAASGEEFAAIPHFPYDEVRDWVQAHRNHFDELDQAAEALAERIGRQGPPTHDDLIRHLRDAHGIAVADDPEMLSQGTVWRLQRAERQLWLAQEATPASRLFWMAHVIGLLEQRGAILSQIRAARLATGEARALARIGLANYFAGALLMPYERFLTEAERLRYDIERLQSRFGTSFEQVCHRLSTLQRASRPGIPFFLVKTDIAGNVLKRSSATRFRFARFGGPCPLWNVYRAFTQPGRVLAQVAQTPDGVAYLSIARTVGRGGGAYLSRPRNVAVVIGCEIDYARQTVYAAGLDLEDRRFWDQIGPGCRACERTTCRHRAVPPAGQTIDVGSLERGMVPYRIRG